MLLLGTPACLARGFQPSGLDWFSGFVDVYAVVVEMNDPLPWERQKGESRQAFRAFAAYRDMGPTRSLVTVAQELGRSTTLMERWSVKWRWQDRTAAYDAEQDRIARTQLEQERLDARLSRLSVYEKIMLSGERVMDRFQRVVESEQLDKLDLARAKVKGKAPDGSWIESERRAITDLVGPMVPAIAEAAKGQRLEYGEATERREETGTIRHEHEVKGVEEFASRIAELDAEFASLGVSAEISYELMSAIARADAGAEGADNSEPESG